MESAKSNCEVMTPDEQLQSWLQGQPMHNPTRDECCPDFSCCHPELLAPEHVRKAFVDAHARGCEATKVNMLYMFLGRALQQRAPDAKVHLAGDPTNQQPEQ
jgi:hypothetical protein